MIRSRFQKPGLYGLKTRLILFTVRIKRPIFAGLIEYLFQINGLTYNILKINILLSWQIAKKNFSRNFHRSTPKPGWIQLPPI